MLGLFLYNISKCQSEFLVCFLFPKKKLVNNWKLWSTTDRLTHKYSCILRKLLLSVRSDICSHRNMTRTKNGKNSQKYQNTITSIAKHFFCNRSESGFWWLVIQALRQPIHSERLNTGDWKQLVLLANNFIIHNVIKWL